MTSLSCAKVSNPHLKDLKKWLLSGLIFLCLVLSVFYNSTSENNALLSQNTNMEPLLEPGKIWISLALCWGHNTRMLNKAHFPYDIAGQLSSKLWVKFNYSVMYQIVVCQDEDVETKEFKDYVQDLTKEDLTGAIVVKIVKSESCDKCVLTAQVSRLLAFQQPEVEDDDVVVMSDVDTFPMKSRVLDPIKRQRDKLVWVFRYDTAVNFGFTFSMAFTAMRSRTWNDILGHPTDFKDLMDKNYDRLHFENENNTWGIDQAIMTRGILENKLCTIPTNSTIWTKMVYMDPIPNFDDWQTCYHGENYDDCHREYFPNDCKHWHFLPIERKQELMDKYNEIIGVKKVDKGMTYLAKNVQFELTKLLGFRS